MVRAMDKGHGNWERELEWSGKATWEDLEDRGRPPGRGTGQAVRNWW